MSRTHTIKNQNGQYICDDAILNEIHHIIENRLDYGYFDGQKIEIVKDFRSEKYRETVVYIKGIG